MSLLDVEPLIVERLTSRMPGKLPKAQVLIGEDLAGLEERELPPASIHILPGGYRVLETSPTGAQARVEQQWVVVAVIKHPGLKAPAEGRSRVKPLVDGVLAALMGWRPALNMKPMRLASGPAPRWRNPYYYFPLAFAADIPVQGDKP